MAAIISISSPADAVNAALRSIGYQLRVGTLLDGSKAANLALDIYGQARDSLLREHDWGFAERNLTATLLKQAPDGGYVPGITPWDPVNYPPLDARFEYAYPDDCLKLRALKPTPVFVPNYDPRPHAFRIANDQAYTPARKVILCNVANAILTYTGRITDPTQWEPSFADALIQSLARWLAPSLENLNVEQVAAREAAIATAKADMQQG